MHPVSDRYLNALRFPHRRTVRLEAWRAGARVDEALYGSAGLPVDAGQVTVTAAEGPRRLLDVTLAPDAGLYEWLTETTTELRPFSVLRYPNGTTETVPLGRFTIGRQRIATGGGGGPIEVRSAPDPWARIQRGRFLRPRASTRGILVVDQIAALARDVLGAAWPVRITATSTATMGSQVWERDRDKAILGLAAGIGADVAIAADGTLVIRDLPVAGQGLPVWTIAGGAGGVLLTADREHARDSAYNVVVVTSTVADGSPPFAPQIVWDDDPTSSTYAGPDPADAPQLAGPFGVVPYFLSTPLPLTASQARQAGRTRLTRLLAAEVAVNATASPNPALDAFDPVEVIPERLVEHEVAERHLIDRVTHPLTTNGAQAVVCRSNRPGRPIGEETLT